MLGEGASRNLEKIGETGIVPDMSSLKNKFDRVTVLETRIDVVQVLEAFTAYFETLDTRVPVRELHWSVGVARRHPQLVLMLRKPYMHFPESNQDKPLTAELTIWLAREPFDLRAITEWASLMNAVGPNPFCLELTAREKLTKKDVKHFLTAFSLPEGSQIETALLALALDLNTCR